MRLILASSSPRRSFLLREVGLAPEIRSPNVDESLRKGEEPKAMVARLSREKAAAVAREIGAAEAIVLAADTTVVSPDGKKILGKPENPASARRMLKGLAGRVHTVFTGYTLLEVRAGKVGRKFTGVVATRVKMRKLSTALIEKYVRTGEPMDKAGSYAAQGLGMALIEEIRGSYTNVVGLPIEQVLANLETRFEVALFSWKEESDVVGVKRQIPAD